MILLLSPAKTLDMQPRELPAPATLPALLKESRALIKILRDYDPKKLGTLMHISPKLAALNHQRFHDFKTPFTEHNAAPAIYAFRGDVYDGLQADNFTRKQLLFAQQHLRMLSGLYGVLRPFDLMQAYRLEMGTKLPNARGANLYDFWGERITALLNEAVTTSKSRCVINLASQEYAKAVHPAMLPVPLVGVDFKDYSGGSYKIVALFAKRARGLMASYVIENGLKNPKDLVHFDRDGYRYDPKTSQETLYCFKRRKPS